MSRHSYLFLLLLLPGSLTGVAHAQASRLNRCTDAQGQSVYTDRPCQSVNARPRMPDAPPLAPGEGTHVRGQLGAPCPRRLSELVGALRSATSSQDVNRLSSLYLWGSVSDAEARRVLGQLESIARRPLVDIAPVYPQRELAPPSGSPGPADTPEEPRPIALRLEQVLPGTATPARSVLALRRQHGCFWITL